MREAIVGFEVTFADRKRVLGSDHPDTLSSAAALVRCYRKAGHEAKATSFLEVTSVDRRKNLGHVDPETE